MGSAHPATSAELRRWIALVCLVLAVALFFHHVLLGEGVLFFRDICLNHYPTRLYVTPLLRSGHLPLWNPYLSGGMPLASNPNNLIFHPITVLFLILPVAVAFHASIILQYLLAGWGMLRWGREEGLREESALAGALTYSLSGGLASCGSLQNLLSSWAWVPVALWAFARHRNSGSRPALVGFSGALAVQLLSGDPVAAGTTLLLALADGWWGAGSETISRPRCAGVLALGAAAGLGLALVQILPARELLAFSGRAAGIPYPDASVWSIPPIRLIEGVVPALYGDPTALRPITYWGGMVFEKGYPFLLSLYVGAVPFLLALCALGRTTDRRVLILWIGALISILASLGPGGLVYPLLYKTVPLIGSLRYPSRLLLPAFICLSCLASLGLERLRMELPAKRIGAGLRWVLAGSLILALSTAWVGLSRVNLGRLIQDGLGIPGTLGAPSLDLIAGVLRGRFLRCALLAAGLSAVVLTVRRTRLGPSLVSALVVLAIGGDLISANYRVNPVVPKAFYEVRPPVVGLLRDHDPAPRVYSDRRPPGFAVLAQSDSAWWGYYWDLISARASAGLPYRIWMAYDQSTDLLSPRAVNSLSAEMQDLDASRLRRLSDLASVGVLATYRDLDDPSLIPAGRIAGQTNVPLHFYRNRDPLPRAYLVARARPEHGTALSALTDPDFEPGVEIYLEGIGAPEGTPDPAGRVRLLERSPEQVVLEISATRPGWVVLTDNFYPGWAADLDGRRVPILRANYLFRAVAVEGGEHRVVFRYRPLSFLLGAAGSATTLLGCLLWASRRRKRDP